jgi:iron complex outermembrane receptor protein
VEHNSYTGFEYQPNGRLAWTPAKDQTVWAAVSRAVRTPARIDRDFFLYLIPNLPLISGTDSFRSEKMTAYELGWRLQPLKNLSLSLATFYNVYDDLRSAEPGPPPFGIPITFRNGVKGHAYGFELSATHQLTNWWKLRGGYSFFKKALSLKPGSKDLNGATAESDDPENQFLIQSAIDLPHRVELGTVIRYISKLPKPAVPAYMGLDIQLRWKLNKVVELNIVGQNLLDNRHPEFVPSSPSPREIERSLYGKIICRL